MRSFGRGRIGVRHDILNILSERAAVAAFPASLGMAPVPTTQAPYRLTSIHTRLGGRRGPSETINGRRALATADEVIECEGATYLVWRWR
jgi:hypothetical protein